MELLEIDWRETAAEVGFSEAEVQEIFADLCRRYSEPERAYHTLDHVAAMLGILSEYGAAVQDSTAVRLAAWFHDAVYDTHRADNEEQSAAYAAAVLHEASPSLLASVQRLILATKTHQAVPNDPDCQLLLDADLAVFGASRAEYDRYAQAIHAEYAWVPNADYRRGRRQVLEHFLESRIYRTPRLFQQREQAARANLRREIAHLADLETP